MKSAALRLESFAFEMMQRPTVFSPVDIDQAYHDGHERGLAEGREHSMDRLSGELAQICQSMHLTEAEATKIRRETLASVGPILTAIVELLGPVSSRERLLAALGDELGRIVQSGTLPKLQIKCAPDLRADLQDCLDRAGIQGATLDDSDPAMQGADLFINGGSISFDPARAVTEIKTFIAELQTEE